MLATLQHLADLFGAERDNQMKITTEGARYYFHVTNGEQFADQMAQVFS
jgi:hypothetical protein